MKVSLNGRETELSGSATVADAVVALGHDASGRGLAAAVNGEVVPRSRWIERSLAEGDRIEVLTAVGGG